MTAALVEQLLAPVSVDRPCGANLDDRSGLVPFDGYRLWGRVSWIETGANGAEVERVPDWRELERLASETLAQSKDLRVLACLGAAVLRTEGLGGFARVLGVAADWTTTHWDAVFPLLEDGDALSRSSALNCFGDQLAVIDGIRRAPLVSHRQMGRYGLRDIETTADLGAIDAAFMAVPIDELHDVRRSVTEAGAALSQIEGTFRDRVVPEDAPNFDGIRGQFQAIDKVLRARLKAHPDGGEVADDRPESAGEASAAPLSGVITSRQDAIRALDAVAAFFRQHEPSSPVPLLVDRAKRLVSKDFMEVLADIAPDALQQARSASGLKDGQ